MAWQSQTSISSSMTDNPLYISIIWHMHQPFYKDPGAGYYRLPWVRLHGTKDYLDMLEILLEFPEIKATYNFTPSLIEQILDYTNFNARDYYQELTLKNPSSMNRKEKIFLLKNFFLANWDNMIKPFPRYYELLVKRGLHLIGSDLERTAKSFSDADFRDLQVLFNLSWIDPIYRKKDPFLNMLVQKGRDYTDEEKEMLIEKQLSILKYIVPRYSEAFKKGQIEISLSPFYHPILPLLCDTNVALQAMPDVKMPAERFSHPEDAEKQIRMGIKFFEKIFGSSLTGMWPSEGSVSEDVLRIAHKEGIQWIGTDEDILSASLGKQLRDSSGNIVAPETLYRPYLYENVSIVFRDHYLSDLIGFVYSKWEPKRAADDFLSRIVAVGSSVSKNKPHLLSIILDGENAWEFYKNDGQDFLRYLYEGLSREKRLKTVTVSEYLKQYGMGESLQRLHAGSWINANFSIWIGHEEDNTAWDYLAHTREALEVFQRLNPERDISDAWKYMYIAEGSDWNWWYGDEHTTDTQKDFDELFRLNLMNVYKKIGKEIPGFLFVPVLKEDRSVSPAVNIRGFIDPKIDGVVTSYYEWYQGAYMEVKKFGGSMHRAESILSFIYYGFNKDNLFLRIDPVIPFVKLPDATLLYIETARPSSIRIMISLKPYLKAELFEKSNGKWEKKKDIREIAANDILEIAIPFHELRASEKDEIQLSISVLKDSEEIERYPFRGYICITVPTADFEAMMWY